MCLILPYICRPASPGIALSCLVLPGPVMPCPALRLGSAGLDWARQGSAGLGWVRLGSAMFARLWRPRLVWYGHALPCLALPCPASRLESPGLGSVGLGSAGLDWALHGGHPPPNTNTSTTCSGHSGGDHSHGNWSSFIVRGEHDLDRPCPALSCLARSCYALPCLIVGFGRTRLDSARLGWARLDSTGLYKVCASMATSPCVARPCPALPGLALPYGWARLGSAGLHWTPLGSTGLDWVRLNWLPAIPSTSMCLILAC